jgi:hypothetical protein
MKYFEAFGEGGFHSALMTTYSFGTFAFEDIAFPKLRGAGCRNIVVLADRLMLNQALAEYGASRFAGSSYHLAKAEAPGAFHPKITMLVGATKGRLMVGSANLTALGLGGNRELIADIRYEPDLPDHAGYFAAALAYIRRYVTPGDPWFETSVNRALRNAPWLKAATAASGDEGTNPQLALILDQPDRHVLAQIQACIGSDTIERLVVLSPFWDVKLEGLKELRTALGNPPTDLLIERGTDKFPAPELASFPGTNLFDSRVTADNRYVHAKLIVALGKGWDHVVSGSINCSLPALWGAAAERGNAEAGMYRRVPRGIALAELALDGYMNTPLEIGDIAEMTRPKPADRDPKTAAEGGTLTLQSERLFWVAPVSTGRQPATLRLFGSDGEALGEALDISGAETPTWRWPIDKPRPKSGNVTFVDGIVSAPIQVTDLDVLAVATLPPQRGRRKQLIDTVADILHEDLILIEALNELEALELDGIDGTDATPPSAKPAKREERATPEYGVLPYEEFVRARTKARLRGHEGDFINGRQDSAASILSASLNRLIGLMGPDLAAAEDKDLQALNAISFKTTEQQSVPEGDSQSEAAANGASEGRKSERAVATAMKLRDAVAAFERRCKSLQGLPIKTSEIVRLRALLQIVLTHAEAVRGPSQPQQILPVYHLDGFDWPRLIGRLLIQHFGTSRALQNLHVEQDEGEQQRVVEYLALATWAGRAAQFAVDADPRARALRGPIARLATSIRDQAEAILSAVPEDRGYFDQVCAKLDERFEVRLGVKRLS